MHLGGKSDEKRIIPINDSVSVTLNSDEVSIKIHLYEKTV